MSLEEQDPEPGGPLRRPGALRPQERRTLSSKAQAPNGSETLLIPTSSGSHALRHVLVRGLLGRSSTAPSAAANTDGDAAPHLGVYRTVVRYGSPPIKGHRVRVARVQPPRIERAVVGGHRVRQGTVVGPRYRASRFNSGIGWVKEVVPYANLACILHRHRFHATVLRPGGGHEHEQGDHQ